MSSPIMGTVQVSRDKSSADSFSRPVLGHRASVSVDNDISDHDNEDHSVEMADAGVELSPVADDKSRKRRRSRKGLDKRYECTAEGCGKSYSRAEHLYRHQLNHNSKQIFRCGYPDCSRTFVRGDLLKRHMDRHNVKGSQLNRRGSTASRAAGVTSPTSVSPDSNQAQLFNGSPHRGQTQTQAQAQPLSHPQIQPHEQASTQVQPQLYSQPQPQPQLHLSMQAEEKRQTQSTSQAVHQGHSSPTLPSPHGLEPLPMTHASTARYPAETANATHAMYGAHSPPGALHPQRPLDGLPSAVPIDPRRHSIHTSVGPFDAMPSIHNHQGYHPSHVHPPQSPNFSPQHHDMPFGHHPGQYARFQPPTVTGEGQSAYSHTTSAEFPHASDLAMLDHMTMQGADAVLGDESLNRSPYVGMPEDFMVYLFNTLPPTESPAPSSLPPPLLNYGHLNNQYAATPHVDEHGATALLLAQPQHSMTVNNLLDQDAPEASITEHRSQEIFDFIRDRFRENEREISQRSGHSLLGGNRSAGDHVLSRRMMQAYLGFYWHHFSDQMPIIHKPTFSAERTPNLLLLAIMAIGAACLEKTRGVGEPSAGAEISNFLAEHLRWEVFLNPDFRAPAKLWIFQTLILLELYEKMYSTRELHERGHIHHGTTITLMRRGRALISKTILESPSANRDGSEGSGKASSSGAAHTPDEWWNHWIINEATRRAAFAAFVIDSTHATMFGHSAVMVAHEMRLPLPCDESLWKASSSAEVGRVEANLMSVGIKPMAFLEGLKRTLSHQKVNTTSFGRTVLIAGLLSVTYHMHQRDLQVNILGGGVIQALGGRDKWRATLTRAYDSWKSDFDAALEHTRPSANSYGQGETSHELTVIAESRTALHHLAHMAMHADIIDCQIYARAKRLLGRSIGPQEFSSAERRIKNFWAPSARARDAAFYALKFLCSVLTPCAEHDDTHGQSPRSYNMQGDFLMNRPWVLYFAALVVWCYGYATEGPCLNVREPRTHQEKWQHTRAYLAKYGGITDPNELRDMRGVNGTTGLLMVLKDAFEGSRWELLQEGAALMHNCISLNHGSFV